MQRNSSSSSSSSSGGGQDDSGLCDRATRAMLGHLLAFEFRMGHRFSDNSAAQSAKDMCCAAEQIRDYCARDQLKATKKKKNITSGDVERSIDYDYVCATAGAKDLRDVNIVRLWQASPALRKTLIRARPSIIEQLHWQLAFVFPNLLNGPKWWE